MHEFFHFYLFIIFPGFYTNDARPCATKDVLDSIVMDNHST
jgi:hypothetical protein